MEAAVAVVTLAEVDISEGIPEGILLEGMLQDIIPARAIRVATSIGCALDRASTRRKEQARMWGQMCRRRCGTSAQREAQ